MLYLIDAYNFLFYYGDEIEHLESSREELIDFLLELIPKQGAHQYYLIFDAHKQSFARNVENRKGLHLIFTDPGQTADQHLLEILHGQPNPKLCVLVTEDRHLAMEAKALDARHLSNAAFLKTLRNYKRKEGREESNDLAFNSESYTLSSDYERYRHLFNERLDEENL